MTLHLVFVVIGSMLGLILWRWVVHKYGENVDLCIRVLLAILIVGAMVGLALFA